MSAPVERVIAVDWSGARNPKGLWLAEIDGGVVTRLHAPGGRTEAIAAIVRAAGDGRRVAAGLDFSFSFPAWFVAACDAADGPAFWDVVAERGEAWLAAPAPPFWTLGTRASGETGPRALRETERRRAGRRVAPKSVFQLAGPGQVGTMTLRGIPFLRDLRAAGLAVWPFDVPDAGQSVVVEIYPRALYGDAVVKLDAAARAAHVETLGVPLDDAQRRHATDNDHAFDALVSAVAMWRARAELAALGTTDDAEADPALDRVEGRIWVPGRPA